MSQYAFCSASIAPVRQEADDASEMVSQLLFGEPLEILEENNQWRKVQSLIDGYVGWTDFKLLGAIREKELNRWLDGLGSLKSFSGVIHGEFGKQVICRGAFLPEDVEGSFNIGKFEYQIISEDNFALAKDRTQAIINLCLDYLNVPYLWGGKSTSGIDCSGLVQTIMRCVDVKLPRDADQQVDCGSDVDWEDRTAGDLAFFINAKEKIHHVGILINPNEIVHAHGFVRIDDLTEEGIIRRTDNVMSHKFHSIKRL